MNTYFDLAYRTFTIGFTNTNQRFMFQDLNGLRKALEVARLQGAQDIDINSTKELNSFGRLVKVKDMPEWLLLAMSRDIEQRKEERVMQKNEM